MIPSSKSSTIKLTTPIQNSTQKARATATRAQPTFYEKGYVIITGGAGDIGSATAHQICAAGGSVALFDLNKKALQNLHDQLPNNGKYENLIFQGNVCNQHEIDKMMQRIENERYEVYGLFNNAGLQGKLSPLYECEFEDFQEIMDVNVVGAFKMIKSVATFMKDNGHKGAVVNTASAAYVGVPNMIAYAMSKAAIVGMSRSAAKDLAHFGIRVNAISPGHLGGAMWDDKLEQWASLRSQYWPHGDIDKLNDAIIDSIPLRRLGSVEEVANLTCFLLSDAASFITGENFKITGGD